MSVGAISGNIWHGEYLTDRESQAAPVEEQEQAPQTVAPDEAQSGEGSGGGEDLDTTTNPNFGSLR